MRVRAQVCQDQGELGEALRLPRLREGRVHADHHRLAGGGAGGGRQGAALQEERRRLRGHQRQDGEDI